MRLLAAASLAAGGVAIGLLVTGQSAGGADIGGGGALLLALFLSALTAKEAYVLRRARRARVRDQ